MSNNQLTISFGGEGNIKVETLTEFLNKYKSILYLINEEFGYTDDDLIVEVSPPENGSFRIKLKSKYKDLLLDKMGDLSVGTLVGLIVLFATNMSSESNVTEVKNVLNENGIENEDVINSTQTIYQKGSVHQNIRQTFVIVENDDNISNLIIDQFGQQIVSIDRSEFSSIIENGSQLAVKDKPQSDVVIDEAVLIIKTIHFEGNAKWAFIFRGYPIKATIKDQSFIERLKTEAFMKGDSLKVKLSRKRNYDEDLQTYIVDQSSYMVTEVIEHKSKVDNQNKLDL